MKIEVSYKNKGQSKDYQQLVCDKLDELNILGRWKKISTDAIAPDIIGHSNEYHIVRMGLIQTRLIHKAYFGGSDKYIIYLKLIRETTWEEVYTKIKDIEDITWKTEE
jgi:hypothetical protein